MLIEGKLLFLFKIVIWETILIKLFHKLEKTFSLNKNQMFTAKIFSCLNVQKFATSFVNIMFTKSTGFFYFKKYNLPDNF